MLIQAMFTGILDVNTTMFFILEEVKETILDFFTNKRESNVKLFCFKIIVI